LVKKLTQSERLVDEQTQGPHTEATRKKLREAAFFLRKLYEADRVLDSDEPEEADFYLSAFLTAARAVQFALKKERTDEWNAWIGGWVGNRSTAQLESCHYLVDQRNKVEKEGGPEVTLSVLTLSVVQFMREISERGGSFYMSQMPGLPPPTFSKQEITLAAYPDQPLWVACQPLFEVMKDLVEDFERDHNRPNRHASAD
jgi:hypothetical protein